MLQKEDSYFAIMENPEDSIKKDCFSSAMGVDY